MKLGVNIDHSATLRQVRYRGTEENGEPDIIEVALLCEKAQADGITAHLREDRRHIIDSDIYNLNKSIKTRLNLEMAITGEMVDIAHEFQPAYVCLVPEKREEVTTEGGLDVRSNLEAITTISSKLQSSGATQVSCFIDADEDQVRASADSGAKLIEIHTGPYAHSFHDPGHLKVELEKVIKAADLAHGLGLAVNAGHGLNYSNVRALIEAYPDFYELNIGHSIICRALFVGIEQAVAEMRDLIPQ